MMKLSILFFVGLFVVACSKSKRMVNKLAGTWQFYDILHYDGSHSYPNETYIFENGGREYLLNKNNLSKENIISQSQRF